MDFSESGLACFVMIPGRGALLLVTLDAVLLHLPVYRASKQVELPRVEYQTYLGTCKHYIALGK